MMQDEARDLREAKGEERLAAIWDRLFEEYEAKKERESRDPQPEISRGREGRAES